MKEMNISLKGLTCANCAGKIEKAVGEMPETKEAEINLLKQEMRLVPAAEADRTKLLEKVTETVHKYESDVEVSLVEKKKPQGEMNRDRAAGFLMDIVMGIAAGIHMHRKKPQGKS